MERDGDSGPHGPLMRDYVVVDVETTGLNPVQDAIIQLAAVRSDGARWHSFVNPGRPVPASIMALTGLGDVDFSECPALQDVMADFQQFIGERTVVGHNVAFDRAFLEQAGVRLPKTVDTLAWARLAFANRKGYRLADFYPDASDLHDARGDAERTRRLIPEIRAALGQLPGRTRQDLARLLGDEWTWWDVPETGPGPISPLDRPAGEPDPPDPPAPLSQRFSAEDWFEGHIAGSFEDFELRPGQREMVSRVGQAFTQGHILLAEAGTGTGKSLAYLAPALAQCAAGRRVVIATYTVSLQEQLWQKDLPRALRGLALNTSALKGRGRYVCLLKADAQREEFAVLGESRERRWAMARLLTFIAQAPAGDIDEFHPRTEAEHGLWREVVADWEACAGPQCPFAGPCFMRRARREAEGAHLIVTNHALLAADLAQGNDILPEYDLLVIDEAHHWAEVVERSLGLDLDLEDGLSLLADAIRPRGLWERMAQWSLTGGDGGVVAAIHKSQDALADLVRIFVQSTPPGESDRQSVRMTEERRERLSPILDPALALAQEALAELSRRLTAWADTARAGNNGMWLKFQKWQQDVETLAGGLEKWQEMDAQWVYWWEMMPTSRGVKVVLRSTPLDIADTLRESLWDRVGGAVLTSATLGADQDFSLLGARLGIPLERVKTGRWPSPFDTARRAALVIPKDAPDIREAGYLDVLAAFAVDAAVRRRGKTLILTTSHKTVKGLAWRMRAPLEHEAITLWAQGLDGSAARLVEEFTRHPRSVLLGTLSYWEGVDVPGSGLEQVIIARLPFASPGDPVEEARQQLLAAQGRSAFYEWSLPQAILRFRQGFGRLLRTHRDRGVVVVFDQRVHPSKSRYGARFLQALGPVAVIFDDVSVLPDRIEEFFRRLEEEDVGWP